MTGKRPYTPKVILKNVFGYDTFRPLQADVIDNIINKQDTLVIMPTGGGKSLCYQIPAIVFDGLTVVISPLISLMKDQVEQLTELGVDAIYLNSSLPPQAYTHNLNLVRQGKIKLLYLAPETLLKPDILNTLSTIRVDALAIDEAHCISAWGHDFRPEYRQIESVRSKFPHAVCVALTATATPQVRRDIIKNLNLKTSNEFIDSFNRSNLFLNIDDKKDPVEQTIAHISRFPDQSGIIYCFSRRQVEDLYAILNIKGYSAKPYHAGLTDGERKKHQEMFIKDDVRIMIATIAFGMGINKPDVRYVIHYDLPKNIEGYYQEIGRAGRDGLRAECLLLFSYADTQKIRYFINQKSGLEKQAAGIHLTALLRFAETEQCRRIPLLNYFGESYSNEDCGMCDNCLAEKKPQMDITIPAQKFLSCVKRTGEIFGANHVIDVLRGSESKKIFKFDHQMLSTYGIGKDLSKKQWFSLSRQMLNKDLITQDMDHGSLKLTQKAWDVFKGDLPVYGRIEEDTIATGPLKRPGLSDPAAPEYDQELYELLRKKRKELADNANVPPYVIFPDKTFIEMAYYYPQSLFSLAFIHGVGEKKLKKYGQTFLDIIRAYCESQGKEEKPLNK